MDTARCHMSQITDLTSIENQNLMRMRVNRVSLIQDIHVEDILDALCEVSVLTPSESKSILEGATSQDRARTLIDLLPTKGKESGWYKNFRQALKSAKCEVDRKRKYENLCNFLDNTIINRKVKETQPATCDIAEKKAEEFDAVDAVNEPVRDKVDDPVDQGEKVVDLPKDELAAAHKKSKKPDSHLREQLAFTKNLKVKIEGFASVLRPTFEAHISRLEAVDSHLTKKLIKIEKKIFKKVESFEVLYTSKRRNMFDGERCLLCFTKPFNKILSDFKRFHFYYKYLRVLEDQHLQPVIRELCGSFTLFVSGAGTADVKFARKRIVRCGFHLFEFLKGYGSWLHAEDVMRTMLTYLSTSSIMECWVPSFCAYVKLIESRTFNMEYVEADQAYRVAHWLADQIDGMSWGRAVLDKAEFMAEVSHLMLAQGIIQNAFDWASTALQNLRGDNKYAQCRVVRRYVEAYSGKWNIKRAEKLAVYLIHYAWSNFGEFSPEYQQALLTFVDLSNEFRKDAFGVEVAQHACSFTELTFGCHSPLLACSYLALAQAYMAAGQLENKDYLKYSYLALGTATNCFPANHPIVARFKLVLGEALISEADISEATSAWAKSEISFAIGVFTGRYGELSLPVAKARLVMVRLLTITKKIEKAQELYKSINEVYQQLLNPRDHQYLHFQVNYAKFLLDTDEIALAGQHLVTVVDNTECYGAYVPWVDEAYQSILSLHKDDETQLKEWTQRRQEWLDKHPQRQKDFTWEELHQKPDESFLSKWEVWGSKKKNILKRLDDKRRQKEEGATTAIASSSDPEQHEGTEDSDPDSTPSSSDDEGNLKKEAKGDQESNRINQSKGHHTDIQQISEEMENTTLHDNLV